MPPFTHADEHGYFGRYGGAHLPPHLVEPIAEVAAAYEEARTDPTFMAEYRELLREYVGRPSPLFLARRLTEHLGGAQVWAKREDVNSGLAFGGNKTRKMEYIVPDILASGADTLVVFRPGTDVLSAVAEVDARLVQMDPSGSFAVLRLPSGMSAWRLYRHGAVLVQGTGPAGCLNWSRAARAA